MFQGTSLLVLDEKGRLSVPKRHRTPLVGAEGSPVTVTRHPDGCLVLYPESVWSRKRSELVGLPYGARAFVRYVLGSAVDVKLDRAGRLLVPADLRELMGITHEVALVGVGAHLELWDRARFEEAEWEAVEQGFSAADFSF